MLLSTVLKMLLATSFDGYAKSSLRALCETTTLFAHITKATATVSQTQRSPFPRLRRFTL
ncbi:hypothetical protein GXM_09894 [Nostoc sphaeroides CCNUC1]|uniref:Uncharacterized protein n=1 Tax=Nostoc sphaeroides CCNUC1 TaxID=2653204 RepID=A0A5P8WII0_9NOSO|nr:hypothetical protein GXM_09894 [Nostoc sphaeroides CCNUC1]